MNLSNISKFDSERDIARAQFKIDSYGSVCSSDTKSSINFIPIQAGGLEKSSFIPFARDKEELQGAAEDMMESHEGADRLEQEGYNKGFAQGEKDGFELGEKRAAKLAENIEKLFDEMSKLKKEIIGAHEKQILELILAIAEKITHQQLQIDEKIIKESVFKSLELAIEKSKITFRVNPADYGYVEKLRPKLFATHKEIKSVMVVSDEAVHRGGCFLETAHGDVDASIESQLEIIRRSLEEAYTQREDD